MQLFVIPCYSIDYTARLGMPVEIELLLRLQ